MLKTLTLKNIPGISEKIIIKKEDIVHYNTINEIYDHAKSFAKKTISAAESRVDGIHNNAWIEGYVSGMAFAIQDLAKFVNDNETHKNNIINDTLEIVTNRLKEFFDHEETLCQLLTALTEQLNKEIQDNPKVTLTVPETLYPHSHKVKKIFIDNGLAAEVKRSPHQGIVVEYGKEIWTFEISKVTDKLARSALEKALLSDQLQKQCALSSLQALHNIRDTLTTYLDELQQLS